ncbi:MAG: alpha/beta hydrolase [Microscillaceae bacterium]|jgi:pimeloyl-ACP methyl ester carboxylesterase|nr:alpha/beta hydrolase [Microscillaceae bacterium]
MTHFMQTNGIQLHYLDFAGGDTTLILMPGLTANAHAFDGLIQAGLNAKYRVIAVDLRGRGLSDKPETGYGMADHAQDILGLLDQLGIQKATIGGHSFGALLTFYLASHFPERVEKMVLLDAAAQMHPNTREMLASAMSRLGQTFPSFADYLELVKKAPYLTYWEDAMLSYYQADVLENEDGTVTQRSNPLHIIEAVTKVLSEPWLEYMQNVTQPAILLNATDEYSLGAPLLPKENALATVAMMKNCTYGEVWGNHQTMLYGQGAQEIVAAIKDFLG